jgi:hypothetical protein
MITEIIPTAEQAKAFNTRVMNHIFSQRSEAVRNLEIAFRKPESGFEAQNDIAEKP